MTGPERWISEAELHGHLDGELPAERCAAVEAGLAADPEQAARLRSYRRQKMLIARPTPRCSSGRSRRGSPPWRCVRRRAGRAVGSASRRPRRSPLLLFAGGAGSGWWLRDRSAATATQGPGFVADALSAHQVYAVEVRHPVEVEAAEADHLVTWLSRRLGVPVAAPDLAAAGFELVGGRLLPAATGPAAQLMYQDASGRRVTLYVRASADPAETAFRFAREGQLTALYWRDHGAAWALLGELPRDELLRLAHAVYQALQP